MIRLASLSIPTTILFAVFLAAAGEPGQEKAELPPISPENAFDHLVVLAGAIGERPAGSEEEARAAEYILDQFEGWGLDARIETFRQPLWHPRSARVWTEGEESLYLPSKAIGFGGTTPPEGVTGELVDLGNASAHHLEGKDLSGKIVLIKRDVAADYPDYWLTERLLPHNIAGMIFYSRAGHPGGMPMAYYNFKRSLEEDTPPSVDITYQDAVRLLKSGPRRVGMAVEAEVTWGESRNVIGDIRGRSRPEEIVLIGGHNDSAITSPGAADDGGGVAIVMELARAFSQGSALERTLRFVAWGGHETGLHGSEAYLRAHPEDVERIVAVLNFDGQGSILGTPRWRGAGPNEWVQFVEEVMEESGLEAAWSVGPSGTDSTNFAALEVPAVSFGQSHSGGGHHTPEDNLKWCGPVGLADGLLMGAMLAKRLADDLTVSFPDRFPPDLLNQVRDYAARWGWGVRPEANEPPPSASDKAPGTQ